MIFQPTRCPFKYAIRLLANNALLRDIDSMLTRPVGRAANTRVVRHAGFLYQAQSWDRARRMVAKVEWLISPPAFPSCNAVEWEENREKASASDEPEVKWEIPA